MQKKFKIEVDCANCANLMEEATNKTEGVASATVNFMTQKMIVELTEMTDENIKIIRSYETNGSAITFAQSSGNAQELQHNNDSQSQIAPQISKEDEND